MDKSKSESKLDEKDDKISNEVSSQGDDSVCTLNTDSQASTCGITPETLTSMPVSEDHIEGS